MRRHKQEYRRPASRPSLLSSLNKLKQIAFAKLETKSKFASKRLKRLRSSFDTFHNWITTSLNSLPIVQKVTNFPIVKGLESVFGKLRHTLERSVRCLKPRLRMLGQEFQKNKIPLHLLYKENDNDYGYGNKRPKR